MEQPPPGPDLPENPYQPPKLNTRWLWLTLLLPSGLTAIWFGLAVLLESIRHAEAIVSLGWVAILLVTVGCWIGFSLLISRRFSGPSRILLILAYPITQAVLIFVTFFCACLIAVSSSGGFH